jgi:hypothetical protein
MAYYCTMDYYWSIKKNYILLFAHKWKELENIILSKVTQVLKAKGHMTSLTVWKIDPNTNTSFIIYTYKYIQNMFPKVELL